MPPDPNATDDPRVNMAMRLLADCFGLRGAQREIADTDAIDVVVSGGQLRSMIRQIIQRCDDQSPLAIAIRNVRHYVAATPHGSVTTLLAPERWEGGEV